MCGAYISVPVLLSTSVSVLHLYACLPARAAGARATTASQWKYRDLVRIGGRVRPRVRLRLRLRLRLKVRVRDGNLETELRAPVGAKPEERAFAGKQRREVVTARDLAW